MKRVNYPMTCIICGKLSKRLGSHVVTKHKITSQQYYDTYLKKEDEGKCIMCGKETPFISITTGYQLHCCAKCGLDDPKTREHFESTMIQKYGVAYASQCDDFAEKSKQTKLEKYGDENYNNRDKAKETCINRYGVEFPNQSNEVKEKIKKTNLERYEVECIFQNKDFIDKSEQTKLERYGSKTYNNKEKSKQTCLDKYGVEYALQSEEIKNKIKQTNLEKYGVTCTLQSEKVKNDIIKHNQEKYGCDWYTQSDDFKEKCENTVLNGPDSINTIWKSEAENTIYNAISIIYDKEIFINTKKIIYPKELDIYIPDLKLAIEFNGILYHSNAFKYPKSGHLDKSLLCREKNIRLIHIYEFEDLDQQIKLLQDLILGQDNYPKEDFNKNNLIDIIPEPEIIYQSDRYTIYGAGPLIK